MRDPLPALTLYGTFREHHCVFFGVADKLTGLPSQHPRPRDRRLVALVAFGVCQFLGGVKDCSVQKGITA